jgi:tyrosine-protein phosphatase YwqE
MKIERTNHSIDIEFKNGNIFEIFESLTEIIFNKQYNWNTWQFINIEFENDRAMQAYEFTFVLLCCGIRIRISTHPKEEHKIHKEIMKSMDILKQSCYGWVDKESYKEFQKRKREDILIFRTKNKSPNRKKIFIQ